MANKSGNAYGLTRAVPDSAGPAEAGARTA